MCNFANLTWYIKITYIYDNKTDPNSQKTSTSGIIMCLQFTDELPQLVLLCSLFALHASNSVIKRRVVEIREDVLSPPGQLVVISFQTCACTLLKGAKNRGLNILFSGELLRFFFLEPK